MLSLSLVKRKFLNEILTQFFKTFGSILLLLGVILLIRFLNQANEGKINSLKILAILGYTLIQYSPPLLAGSFFIALVNVFGRMQQESEIVIWQQMNIYRWKWWQFLLIVSFPLMMVQYFSMNFLTPWAIQKNHQLIRETQTNSTFAQLQIKKFQKIGPATLYIKDLDLTKKRLKEPFFHWKNNPQSTEPTQEKVIFATDGEFQGRTLWLKNGIYQAKTAATQTLPSQKTIFDYVTFKKIGISLPEEQADQVEQLKSHKAKYGFTPNSFLVKNFHIEKPFNQQKYVLKWKKIEEKAEQFWRYSLMLFLITLPFLAWRMSQVSIRKKASSNYLTALLYFMLYLNLTGVVQQQILKQKIILETGFLLHIIFTLIIIYLPLIQLDFSKLNVFNLFRKNT